jgi:[pyruvate, water dikinase]-phosphate phosphotransferase / [pyruvate, water dikinase] kinase
MPHRGTSYFHLHLVSDATGETLITVARAAAAQYASVSPVEHMHPLVRTHKQLDRVLTEIEECARYRALHAAGPRADPCGWRKMPGARPALPLDPRVRCCGCSSPISAARARRVGAQHVLNAEYFKRIDALNYTMLHDDGQHADDLEEADVVLVGVSRTSKTPTSIYLANRGVKTANVPLVPGVPVPAHLEALRSRWWSD